MKRLLAVTLLALTSALAAGSSTATAGGESYEKYALVRDQVQNCVRDRQWHHLGATARKKCKKLRKSYELWSDPGESGNFHVHCLTSKCMPAPEGEPDPRTAPPAGAKVFKP